jgi:photosystem II stability/assembly factor-like uncharacterized protein
MGMNVIRHGRHAGRLLAILSLLITSACSVSQSGRTTQTSTPAAPATNRKQGVVGRVEKGDRPRSAIAAGAFQQALDFPVNTTLGEWRNVGPLGYGGKVSSIAVHPQNPNVVYAAYVFGGGLWRTQNGGTTWTHMGGRLRNHVVSSVAIHTANPNIVYAGLNDLNQNQDQGVLRTSDGGDTWTAIGPAGKAVSFVAAHPDNADTVYAASTDGVYKTTNGGATWNKILSWPNRPGCSGSCVDLAAFAEIRLRPGDPQTILVAEIDIGVARTEDGGANWTTVDGSMDQKHRFTALAWSPSNPDIVYAERPRDGDPPAMFTYKSTDAGKTWTAAFTIEKFHQGRWDMSMAVDPNNSDHVIVGNTYMHESTDGMKSVHDVRAAPHTDHMAIVFAPSDPSIVFSGNDGGVWKSVDGGQVWRAIDQGTETSHLEFFDVDPSSGRIYATARDYVLGIQFGAGIRPTEMRVGYEYFPIFQHPLDRRYVWGNGWITGGSLSRLNLETGDSTRLVPETSLGHYKFGFGFHPTDPTIVYLGTKSLWRSTDTGATFTDLNIPDVDKQFHYDIAVARSNPAVIATGTWSRVWHTSDEGATWSKQSTPENFNGVIALAIDPFNVNTIFAGDTQGLWKSTDRGTTFARVANGPPPAGVNEIAFDPETANTLFVATELGVYVSTDGATTWSRVGADLPVMNVTYVVRAGRKLYAGGFQGLWEMDINGPRGCDAPIYTIPNHIRFDDRGGEVLVNVFASENCEWGNLVNAPGWLQVTKFEKTKGNGKIRLTARPSPGLLIADTLRIGNGSTPITQFPVGTSANVDGATFTVSDRGGASCITGGAQNETLQVQACTGAANQQFKANRSAAGHYRLAMSGSNLCMDNNWLSRDLAAASYGRVLLWTCHDHTQQRLELRQVGEQLWQIFAPENPYPRQCMTRLANGTIAVDRCNEQLDAQLFRLRDVNTPASVSLTFDSPSPGLTVTVDERQTCRMPCSIQVAPLAMHRIAVEPFQSVRPGTRHLFRQWSDGGPPSHLIWVASTPVSYTVQFETEHQLLTAVAPAFQGGAVVPASGQFYRAGSNVHIQANPATGFAFTNWTGSGVADGRAAATTITMDEPKSLVANFGAGPFTGDLFRTWIYSVAGADSVPALQYPLRGLGGIAVDAAGNTYVSARLYHRVLKIDGSGRVSVLAGSGAPGSGGNGGPAAEATLNTPGDLALDPARNILYISDTGAHAVRTIDLATGTIGTLAGTGAAGFGGDGGPAASAVLNEPRGLAVNPANGDVFIADAGNQRVRRVSNGIISTYANSDRPVSLASAAVGGQFVLFVGDIASGRIRAVRSQGTIEDVPLNLPAAFKPAGLAAGAQNLYALDSSSNRVWEISLVGSVRVIGGGGNVAFGEVPATSARFDDPSGIAVGGQTIYVADSGNELIRAFTVGGNVRAFAGTGRRGTVGEQGLATETVLAAPHGLTSSSGLLYVADTLNHRVISIDSSGNMKTVAGTGISSSYLDGGGALFAGVHEPTGIAIDGKTLYIAETGGRKIRPVDLATGLTGKFDVNLPGGFTPFGTMALVNDARWGRFLLFADRSRNAIVQVNLDNHAQAHVIATGLDTPSGVALRGCSATGCYFLIADTGNKVIRELAITANGNDFTTVAGTNNTTPTSIAVDGPFGDVFVTDSANRVRRIDAAGALTSVAGTGAQGFSGDQGVPNAATLNAPSGVTVLGSRVYASDTGNDRIRSFPAPCPYALSAAAGSHSAESTTGSLAITALAGCAWAAVSNEPWVIVAQAKGTGSGTVSYSVTANTASSPRLALLYVGGRIFTIDQAAAQPCRFNLTPPARTYGSAGGADTVAVNTTAGCQWSASTADSWVTITSGPSGTGTGNIGFRVSANASGVPRTGRISAGGQVFSILQSAGESAVPATIDLSRGYLLGNPNQAGGGQIWWFSPITGSPGVFRLTTSAAGWSQSLEASTSGVRLMAAAENANQFWALVPVPGVQLRYRLQNVAAGTARSLAVDTAGALSLQDTADTDSQYWTLTASTAIPIPVGSTDRVRVRNLETPGYLNVGLFRSLEVAAAPGTAAVWALERVAGAAEPLWRIRNAAAGLLLSVANSAPTLANPDDSPAMMWYVEQDGDGWRLVNRATRQALQLRNGRIGVGAGAGTRWVFDPAE